MGTSSPDGHTSELHPKIQELIEYIAGHRRVVHEAVASVPSELHRRRPGADRWSVAEVVEHLSLIEGRIAMLLTRQVAAARERGVGPDEETSSVVGSFVNPEGVVDRTRKIVAPGPVVPSGSLDTTAGTEALAKSRAAMNAALRAANGVSLQDLMQVHPILGTMNMYHWIVALGLHDRRHAAQIREIGQSLAAQ